MQHRGVISAAAATALVTAGLACRYTRFVAAARARVDAIDKTVISTSFGDVEYAESGTGCPVLVVHGIFGGRDAGLLSIGNLLPGRRVIAPSRFGYLGSALPPDATPAMQADAFVEVLDHLAIDSIDVIGYSAGATSALQVALRHPDRTGRLVIMSGNLPGPTAVSPPRLAKVLFSSDVLMWLAKVFARPALIGLVGGVPTDFPLTDDQRAAVTTMIDSIFPVRDRTQGVLFDAFVSNPAVNTYALEAIEVPTLVVHSSDDTLASYGAARAAAGRIPGARLVTLTSGGHLMLGQDATARTELGTFLAVQETPSTGETSAQVPE